MTVLAKQERAALLEWRGSTQSSSSEQGGSYGQYTRTEATTSFPIEATPVAAEEAGERSADAAAVAGDRAAGTHSPAAPGSRLVFRLHSSDLSPHRGIVAGGPPDPRQPYDLEPAPEH